MSKIIGLTTGKHPFHIKIMKENNAEIHHMGGFPFRLYRELFKLPDGDVYITESNFYAPAIKKIINMFFGKKVKIVNIAGSPSIFLNKNPLFRFLTSFIDIMLVEGEFGKRKIREIGFKGATQIIYPSFSEVKHNNKPKSKNKIFKILTIAQYSWKIKGLDLLEESVKDIDCEVNVVGQSSYIPKSNKIKMHGYLSQKDFLFNSLFETSDVYVQFSRFDTFSIATIEAAYKGLPVIVSENCGVKEFVNENYIIRDIEDLKNILETGIFENTFNFKEFEKKDKSLKIKNL